jgi:hypothetical protein
MEQLKRAIVDAPTDRVAFDLAVEALVLKVTEIVEEQRAYLEANPDDFDHTEAPYGFHPEDPDEVLQSGDHGAVMGAISDFARQFDTDHLVRIVDGRIVETGFEVVGSGPNDLENGDSDSKQRSGSATSWSSD